MNKDKLNILQIVSNLDRNGPAYVVNDLASGLVEMGHKVVIASSGGSLEESLSSEILKVYIPIGRKKGKSKLLKYLLNAVKSYVILCRCIKENNINIINAHQPIPIILGKLVSIRTRKVFVTTSHNVYDKKMINRTYTIGDKVVAVSDKVRNNTIEVFKISPNKVITISNGINPAHMLYSKDKCASDFNKGQDEFLFGTIAGLRKQKSLDILLKSFASVCEDMKNAKLVICGDGSERDNLMKLTNELGLVDKVKFLGFRNDIGYVLKNIDVFCLSSQYEGLPISMLEAMALKIPVIVTDVGGIPEVIEDGKNGIMVKKNDINSLANAIKMMYELDDIKTKIAEEGYRTIEMKFSYKIMAAKYAFLYNDLVNRG